MVRRVAPGRSPEKCRKAKGDNAMDAITHATAGQSKQLSRLGADAVEKALDFDHLDHHTAQRVIEHGDEFAEAIHAAIRASVKSLLLPDRFKDEEVLSLYGYLSGYRIPKNITMQCNILRRFFPELGSADEKLAERPLPHHAEGWFAIPKWQALAGTYGEAVQKVFDALRITRRGKFYNCREGELDSAHLRQSARTTEIFQKVVDEQEKHTILVVPAQFGIRHRGRSVRRAREVFLQNEFDEFGLGSFEVGIMLLTHPDRLQHYDDLWVDCAGDDFNDLNDDARFSRIPSFNYFYDGDLQFVTGWTADPNEGCGSASAFVP